MKRGKTVRGDCFPDERRSVAALDIFPSFANVIAPFSDQDGGLRQGVGHHQIGVGVV